MSNRIKRVDAQTGALLSAGYIVPDFFSAVQQVVYNSIDANSKWIRICLDIKNCSFTVDDDGDGMIEEELFHQIGEDNAANSIKIGTYAVRGDYLYNLAHLCELEIESRSRYTWITRRKVIKYGIVHYNSKSHSSRRTPGTTIRVSKLFHRMPVRTRLLQFCDKYHLQVMDKMRAFCCGMSLIWPSISFELTERNSPEAVMRINAASSCLERVMRTFGTLVGSILEYVSFLPSKSAFSIRGYMAIAPIDDNNGYSTMVTAQGMKQAKSYYQFLFFENFWIPEFQAKMIRMISNISIRFAKGIPMFVLKMSCTRSAYEISRGTDAHMVLLKDEDQVEQFISDFVLHFVQRDQDIVEVEEQMAFEEDPNLTKLEHFMRSVAERDSVGETLGSKRIRTGTNYLYSDDALCIPLNKAYRYDSHFVEMDYYRDVLNCDLADNQFRDHCSDLNINSEDNSNLDENFLERKENEVEIDELPSVLQNPIFCHSCHQHLKSSFEDQDVSDIFKQDYSGSKDIVLDAMTYQLKPYQNSGLFVNNESTALSAAARGFDADVEDIFFPFKSNKSRAVKHTPKRSLFENTEFSSLIGLDEYSETSVILPTTDMFEQEWVYFQPGAKKAGKNCELMSQEEDDVVATTAAEAGSKKNVVKSHFFSEKMNQLRMKLNQPTTTLEQIKKLRHSFNLKTVPQQGIKLSKNMFNRFRVIKQVDRKFILVYMEKENIHQFKRHQRDGVDECVLLCIDQHAADERVRLEQMEIEIFGVDGTERNIEFEEFSTPKLLRCNAREVEVLSTFESDIKAWGFDFEISGTRDEENKYCGFVKSTNCESLVYLYSSPRVDTRVANEHDFREYIQMLSEQENFWLSNTVMRPPIVTRLLNSRACRGAIMFGDKLSFDDCKNLLDQLSRCRLPFQCAHGRPSIVPLVQFSDKRDSMSS